jgi:hypothetical protein
MEDKALNRPADGTTRPATLAWFLSQTGDQARIAAKALARHHRVLQGIVVPLAH